MKYKQTNVSSDSVNYIFFCFKIVNYIFKTGNKPKYVNTYKMKILIFEYGHHEKTFYIRIHAIKRPKNNMQNYKHPILNYNVISLNAYFVCKLNVFISDIIGMDTPFFTPYINSLIYLPPGLYLKFGTIC